jgi:diguanylate cyclase (GGDEF)-like protein
MVRKGSWGIPLFVLAVVLLGAGYWILGYSEPRFNADHVARIFFYIGVIAGVVVPLLAHFSYPRVHNLKVFLAGYLIGVASLAFFLLGDSGFFSGRMAVPPIYIPGLYLFLIATIALSILLPTFLKYRHTRLLTIILLLVEVGCIVVLRINTLHHFSLDSIRYFELFQWIALIPATVTITILVLSILALRLKFHLGGVLGGTLLLLSGGWYLGPLGHKSILMDSYVFAVTPVFLGIGIMVHWIVRMEHRASYDPLLRIYNRDYCEKVISEQVGIRTSPPFGIAIIDIDNFKKVNDTYGHKIGDEVLIRVARILSTELVPEGIVCRYGGDEFVVFFPRKNSKTVKDIVERARRKVREAVVRSGNKDIKVKLSIGISHRKNSTQDLGEVLKAADKALYRAKKQGRDQVRYSTG